MKPSFASDYMEGAHEAILKRLVETNLESTTGYGLDAYSMSAKERIRRACGAPDADVFLLVGGTQTNATVIDATLKSYQGVISADTGHISTHEAGAIEYGGHKVLAVPHTDGKISARQIEQVVSAYANDPSCEHEVMPGMVYISHPTEYGTLYSLAELEEISRVCRANDLLFYVDGARLAYALACKLSDVTLKDLARLTDIFYIGGTKCGALFGEAVVIRQKGLIPHFFTIIKQHGALLAKGRLLGLQFDTLFTDGLYERIGTTAIEHADRIRDELSSCGYELCYGSPTNQIFCKLSDATIEKLSEHIEFGIWERCPDDHSIIRLVTSWATTREAVDRLVEIVRQKLG